MPSQELAFVHHRCTMSSKKLKLTVSRPAAAHAQSANTNASNAGGASSLAPPSIHGTAPPTATMSHPTFAPNERVLCFHGPLFYEAKVLKASEPTGQSPTGEPGPHYMVHYKGWKATCVLLLCLSFILR